MEAVLSQHKVPESAPRPVTSLQQNAAKNSEGEAGASCKSSRHSMSAVSVGCAAAAAADACAVAMATMFAAACAVSLCRLEWNEAYVS